MVSKKCVAWWKKNDGRVRLWGSLVGVVVFAWLFGIRSTVGIWLDYKAGMQAMDGLQAGNDTAPVPTGPAVGWEALLEDGKILGKSDLLIREGGLTVVGYTPMLTFQENGWRVHTGELVVAGSFVRLLGLADHIRKTCGHARLASLSFRMNRDFQEGKEQLQMTLWIQQISEKEEPSVGISKGS